MLGYEKAPWGDSVVRASSLMPMENLKVPKQLGQGVPGEERGKGEGSPQSVRRPLDSVLQLRAENALSQVWEQEERGRRGRQEGK